MATAIVRITVTDVNDNNPAFSKDTYEFTVPENEGSFVVGSVSATDLDSTSRGTLRYSLEYANSYFRLDPNTGVISTIKPLDYETKKQHNFTVEVNDGPPSPRTGRAFVIVNVQDVADSIPRFNKAVYNVDFEENKIGALVTVEVRYWYWN